MTFSNKSLIILAVAVLAISIFGTSISLNLLDGLSNVGYVPSDTGSVNLSINTSLSLVLNDNTIDFGTCTLSGGWMTFDSNLTSAGVNNTACNGTGLFPDYMTVENDGNVEANVTVQTDARPSDEYNNAVGSSMEFYSINDVGQPGCGTEVLSWTNFTTVATPYTVCDNFDTDNAADLFNFYIRITLPDTASDAGNDDSMGLTFTATPSI